MKKIVRVLILALLVTCLIAFILTNIPRKNTKTITSTETPVASTEIVIHSMSNTEEDDMVQIPVETQVAGFDDNELDKFDCLEVCPLSPVLQQYIFDSCADIEINPMIVFAILGTESKFRADATHRNNNGTIDRGMAQINSRYEPYFEDIFNRKFDPYNPYDAIDFVICKVNSLRGYWQKRGVDGDELLYCIFGSYNKGLSSFKEYREHHGSSCRYGIEVMKLFDSYSKTVQGLYTD